MLFSSSTHTLRRHPGFCGPSFLHLSVELKLGQFVLGMTITMDQTPFWGWSDGGQVGGDDVGMKGAKTIGRCQHALDVQ